MSENNETPIEPADNGSETRCGRHHRCGRRGRCGHFIMAALAIVGIVSIANIAIGAGSCDDKHSPGDHASRIAMHMLDDVDASDAQRQQVQSIITAHNETLNSMRDAGKKLHQESRALLSAPTIDRTALENLRQQQIASFDRSSREMTAMLADIAEVLTPEQRQQLAEKMQKRFEHHRGHWD